MGRVARTMTAINGAHCVWYRSWNCAIASGMVQKSRSRRRITGQKNPFQVPWNWRIATAARAGEASGSMIRQKVWRYPAPSMRAASSRSRGMLMKYWRSRKMLVPLMIRMRMMPM